MYSISNVVNFEKSNSSCAQVVIRSRISLNFSDELESSVNIKSNFSSLTKNGLKVMLCDVDGTFILNVGVSNLGNDIISFQCLNFQSIPLFGVSPPKLIGLVNEAIGCSGCWAGVGVKLVGDILEEELSLIHFR